MQPPYEPPSPPTTPTSPTWQPPQQMPTLPGSPGGQQKTGLWQRYRGMSRQLQILIASGAAVLVLVCSCCSCGGLVSALNGGSPSVVSTATTGSSANTGSTSHMATPTVPASATQTQATPTTQASATSVPTATPQPKPQPTATPKPKPQPTATPKPSCIPGAVNCNPWGYTFSGGKYITNPPGSFCNYFNCIASFWNGTGYVIECQDATYSKSGGHTGSCSHHGGDLRPLYAP